MQVNEGQAAAPHRIKLDVRAATVDDIKAALSAGYKDFSASPGLSLFFGAIYAAFGLVLLFSLSTWDQIWLAIAAGVGFPLVAPFVASGLYEMSRRMQHGIDFSARDIFLVIFRQQRRELGWMAFIVLFIFWMWAYQVRILFAIILQNQNIHTVDGFVTVLTTTAEGATFLGVGSIVGAAIATILFSLTVVSLPMLLDKDVDFITAMITSFKSVQQSPVVMIGWGACIGAMTLFSVFVAMIGVVFVLPLLGHTSWHLYQRLVSEAAP